MPGTAKRTCQREHTLRQVLFLRVHRLKAEIEPSNDTISRIAQRNRSVMEPVVH